MGRFKAQFGNYIGQGGIYPSFLGRVINPQCLEIIGASGWGDPKNNSTVRVDVTDRITAGNIRGIADRTLL